MYDFEDHAAATGAGSYGSPHPLLTLAEPVRLPGELGSSLAGDLLWPPAPRAGGAGRRVLVLPGFYATDALTARLRGHLVRRGYDARPWGLGRNVGLTDTILEGLLERFDETATRPDGGVAEPVSLVGWSFGGLLARWLVTQRPGQVRQVICLGSPWRAEGERTRATGLFMRAAERHGLSARARDVVDELRGDLPVPVTAIWSRTDGIAHWRGCRVEDGPAGGPVSENIEVLSSHLGLTSNPLVLAAVADRLSQDPADWRPFSWPAALAQRSLGPLAPLAARLGGAA